MSFRRVDFLSAALLLTFVLYCFYLTTQIDLTLSSDLETFTGPRAYPRIILGGMLLLGLIQLGKSWINLKSHAGDEVPPEHFHPRLTKVCMALAALAVFAALFEPLGYLIVMSPLLVGIGYLNGASNFARNAVFSVVAMIVCLIVFRYGLNTILPEGLLGIDQIF